MEQLKDLKLEKSMEWYTLSLWLLKIYEGYIIQYAELDESQAGIKIPGRIISSHRYEDDTSLMAESKEEIKSLLMRKGDAKSGLELNIQKTIHKIILNIHGIQSYNSWHIDEEKCKQWQILFSWLQNHYGP